MLECVKKFETDATFFRLPNGFCEEAVLHSVELRRELYLPTKLCLSSQEDGISHESLRRALEEGYSGACWLLSQILVESEGGNEPCENLCIQHQDYMPCGVIMKNSLDFPVLVIASVIHFGQKGNTRLRFTVMPYQSDSINTVSSYGPKRAEINNHVLPLLGLSFHRTRKGARWVTNFELHLPQGPVTKVPNSQGNWKLEEMCKLLDSPSCGNHTPLSRRLAALGKLKVSDPQLSLFPTESDTVIHCDSQGEYIEVNEHERIGLNLVYGLGAGVAALVEILTRKVDSYAILEP